jgi:type III secretion protein L
MFALPTLPLQPAHRLQAKLAPGVKVLPREAVQQWRQAEDVVAAAHQQALQTAADAAEAFAAEQERGYADGQEQARLEQAEKMIENVSRTIDYFARVESQMVDLVMQSVQKIVSDYDDEARVLATVKNALSVVRNQKQMTLRLHPQQVEMVKRRVNDLLAAYPGVGYLDIVADHRLKADACILESEIGLVEASLEGQLNALRSAFEKILGSRV